MVERSRSPPFLQLHAPVKHLVYGSVKSTRGVGSVAPHKVQQERTYKKKRGQLFMELRFVVPNMEKTFGNLEFAGENTTEQQRINGRMAVITRSYNLYSDVQRADDVVVTLPAKAGEKHFSPEQKVKLINPRITTDGYKIGERGFVNYILLADDMLPAESK